LFLPLEGKRNMTNKLPPVLAKHYTQKTIPPPRRATTKKRY